MRSRVYVTVGCPSVCPSLSPVIRPQQRAAGLLLSAVRAGDTDRQHASAVSSNGAAARRSAANAGSGQCRVDSRVDEAEHRLVT